MELSATFSSFLSELEGRWLSFKGRAASISLAESSTQETSSEEPFDTSLLKFGRKLSELRAILRSIDSTGTFTLPSIVVIGSQSSGKSSVVESIVGHEFLPKFVRYYLSNTRALILS